MMKVAELRRLLRECSPICGRFQQKGHLLYLPVTPREMILQGLYFDSSSFDRQAFYIEAFVLPLYSPREDASFNYGFRLRRIGSEGWTFDLHELKPLAQVLGTAIQDQALPFFETTSDIRGLNAYLKGVKHLDTDPHAIEDLIYGGIITGDVGEVNHLFVKLERAVDFYARTNTSVVWPREVLARATAVRKALCVGSQEAIDLLRSWYGKSLEALGLRSQGSL